MSACSLMAGDSNLARRDYGFSGGDTGMQRSVRRRKIVLRARLAGKEQPVVNGLGEYGPVISTAGQGERVRAARKRIDAPTVNAVQFHALGEIVAEQVRQL